MTVGTLRIRASLAGAQSLKDKRRVLSSLKDRLRQRFNVAVAELNLLDEWRQTELGVATLANDGRVVSSVLSQIENLLREAHGITVLSIEKELL